MSIVIKTSYGVGDYGKTFTPVTLAAAFDRVSTDMKTPMRFIGPELSKLLERTMKARFATEGSGGPIPGEWKKLSKKYREWKQINYPGRKKLVLRGKLKAALTSSGTNALREATDTEYAFGTRGISYASFHQTGTHKMPARPPFDFGTKEFNQRFRDVAQKGIIKSLRAARLDAKETR